MDRASAHVTSPHRLGRFALAGLTALALAAAATPASAAPAATLNTAPNVAPHADAPVPPPAQPGKFVQTELTRILDTRHAIGVPGTTPVPGGAAIKVATQLPADAKAVVMNVTVTGTTAAGYLTVYPDGIARPTTSNLNFVAGQTVPNLVTVPVTNGYVDFYNFGGSADVIADLAGYYSDSSATPGSSYVPVAPSRVLDTRGPVGTGTKAPIGAGSTLNLKVAGTSAVPAKGATAVVLNVTATKATAASYLTVYPHGTTQPATSNLNFVADQTVPNLVTVPLGEDGSVDIYNLSGSVDAVADVFGYYQSAPTGAGFTPVSPKRVLDTRSGLGWQTTQPIGPDSHIWLTVPGRNGVPLTGTTAVVLNVTATDATADSYLTVSPSNAPRPTTSNLNFRARTTTSNLVIVPVGNNGSIDIYNRFGTVNVVADVFGYFKMPLNGPSDLNYGVRYEGAPSCAPAVLGLAQPKYVTATDRVFDLHSRVAAVPGSTGPIWGQFVLTGPEGTENHRSDQVAGDPAFQQTRLTNLTPGAVYTWYTYSTDGTHASEPSLPCTFKVGTFGVPDDPRVATDAKEIHQGDTVKLTITGTTASTAPGDQVDSFVYCGPSGCGTVKAVNGSATVSVVATDKYDLAVRATAKTVVGQLGLASNYGWGITPSS